MSELCLVCHGYESDGEDYIRKDKCSECQQEECTCSECECADCADWLSESETESERECQSGDEEDALKSTSQSYAAAESDVEDSDGRSGSESDDKDVKFKKSDENNTATKELLDILKREEEKKEDDSHSDALKAKTTQTSSDEEEKYPDEILQYMNNRSKRETRRYSNKYSNRSQRLHGRVKSRRRRGLRNTLFSKVKMPSRKIATVTIPQAQSRGFKCGDKTRLITLRPYGSMGRVEYSLIASEMEKTRREHISGAFSGYDIISIQKIVNPCLWKRYRHRRREILNETKYSNEMLLFHGSSAYTTLIEKGMDERYASTTGMFGAGLYFARNSSKSNQYVFTASTGFKCSPHQNKHCFLCERALLLCRVILGKVQEYTTAQRLAHPPVGHHSVKGAGSPGKLKYDEYIVYRGEQVYPEFLIKYKLKP